METVLRMFRETVTVSAKKMFVKYQTTSGKFTAHFLD